MRLVTCRAPRGGSRYGIAAVGDVFDFAAGAAALGVALMTNMASPFDLDETGWPLPGT